MTGIPATPTVTFGSNGTLTETAANGTIGLANLYIPLNFKNASCLSWNAAVQQALPFDMSFQIAYVANHGTRIDVAQNINQPRSMARAQATILSMLASENRCGYTVLPRLLHQLRVSAGPAHPPLQQGARFQLRIYLGQGARLPDRRPGWQSALLGRPAAPQLHLLDFDRKLNFDRRSSMSCLQARHQFFTPGPLLYVLGGWKSLGDYLRRLWPALYHYQHQRDSRHHPDGQPDRRLSRSRIA